MGRKSIPLQLTEAQRKELEGAYQRTDSRQLARRCRIVLRKADSDQPSNRTIAEEVGVQEIIVAKWVRRYRREGLDGLKSRPLPGRPPILDVERDGELVREQVKLNRQRLESARQQIEASIGRPMSSATLRRFLKGLALDSDESA